MADSRRILACAFAGADLLFEASASGEVAVSAGLGGDLAGRPWDELFHPVDRALVRALFEGLDAAGRAGPVAVRGAPDAPFRSAALSVARFPAETSIFCSLSLRPAALPIRAGGAGPDGLYSAEDLERLAAPLLDDARTGGVQLELGLLQFQGLKEALADLSEEEADALQARVAGAVRAEAWGGSVAARLGPGRFAVLRQQGDTSERTTARLARVVGLAAEAALTPLDLDGERGLKLLRASVDAFVKRAAAHELDRQVERVVREAGLFGTLVAERRYRLAYQPVVALATGDTHHYEVLVRFDGDRSPATMIRLAENLDLIESLDAAVLEDAVARLRTPAGRDLSLAVNVSGRSIGSDAFLDRALAAIGRDLGGRLLVELTESSVVEDLAGAAARLAALRERGVAVCLDDFGAGAAAFEYLRSLPVDAVKIDGQYVREADRDERSRAMVRHVAELCRELKIETVAEMVETPGVEATLRAAGVDYGQGFLYGPPAAEPTRSLRLPAVVARRRGTVESWG